MNFTFTARNILNLTLVTGLISYWLPAADAHPEEEDTIIVARCTGEAVVTPAGSRRDGTARYNIEGKVHFFSEAPSFERVMGPLRSMEDLLYANVQDLVLKTYTPQQALGAVTAYGHPLITGIARERLEVKIAGQTIVDLAERETSPRRTVSLNISLGQLMTSLHSDGLSDDEKVRAKLHIGLAHLGLGNRPAAQPYLEEGLKHAKNLDKRIKVLALCGLSRIYLEANQKQKAVKTDRQLLVLKGLDKATLYGALIRLGNALFSSHPFEAIKYYERATKVYTQNDKNMVTLYTTLGALCMKQESTYAKAKRYYRVALDITGDDLKVKYLALQSLISLSRHTDDKEHLIAHTIQMKELLEEDPSKSTKELAVFLYTNSKHLKYFHQWEMAEEHLKTVQELAREVDDQDLEYRATWELANTYRHRKLGEELIRLATSYLDQEVITPTEMIRGIRDSLLLSVADAYS